jgi:hypothetical protein
LDLGRVHGHTGLGDDVAEVAHRRCAKRTLGALQEQLVTLQLLQDANVAEVFSAAFTVDQNVVKEHKNETTKKRAQHIIHECLEGCRGVAQAKRHNQELVEPVVGAERRLVDVLRPHAYLVVA